MRNFSELTEREVLALAIANEEEDNRIYTDIAEGLRADYPASANVFTEMAEEESEHRQRLLELYRAKFGEHIPLIRRQDVRGFIHHKPVWQIYPLSLDEVRNLAESMETETQQFYRRAAARSEDVSVRKLLGDLAEAEVEHEHRADQLRDQNLPANVRAGEDAHARRSLRAAGYPAGTGRTDGWLGLDAGAGVRRRLRHRSVMERVRGRARRLDRRRHLDGFRRGAVGQRQPHRTWRPGDPRRHHRTDDHARRHRSHAALSDSLLLDRHDAGDLRRGGGARP